MKKIVSKIVSVTSAMALAAGTSSYVFAETISVDPAFPLNGNKCGQVIVEADISRDVYVTIDQVTQDGVYKYYDMVMIPASDTDDSYSFVLEGNDEASYNIVIGVPKYKHSAKHQTFEESFMVYDTDEIKAEGAEGYEYTYVINEGEELLSEKVTESDKDENNVIKSLTNLYFPISDYAAGDITMNETIDLYDAIEIAKYIMNLRDFTEDEMEIADFNADGNIDLYDVVGIAKMIMS